MLIHSTSLFTVFDLPDELILSILSYIFPDPPRHIGDYARFRINFLRTLSMTCKAMRLRLLPWVWGRTEVRYCQMSWKSRTRQFDTLLNVLHADTFMATSVRCPCTLLCA